MEDREEDASSRDEDPLGGVRGSGTVGGGAESRPRRGEHTTHLSRFRERVGGYGEGERREEREKEKETCIRRRKKERERSEGRRRRAPEAYADIILSPAVDIAGRSSSPWRIHTRSHERAVTFVRSRSGMPRVCTCHRVVHAHQDAHARDRCRRSTGCMASGVAVFEVRTRTGNTRGRGGRRTRSAGGGCLAARPIARAASPSFAPS